MFLAIFLFSKNQEKIFCPEKSSSFHGANILLRDAPPSAIRGQPKQIQVQIDDFFIFAAIQKSAKMHRRKRTYDDGGKPVNLPVFSHNTYKLHFRQLPLQKATNVRSH